VRIHTHIVPAKSGSVIDQVTTENIAASRGELRDPDVVAAMVHFACVQIRRRRAGGAPARAQATPRTILRLLE
jgi:hypothetical protein